jgi:hypothetical protein
MGLVFWRAVFRKGEAGMVKRCENGLIGMFQFWLCVDSSRHALSRWNGSWESQNTTAVVLITVSPFLGRKSRIPDGVIPITISFRRFVSFISRNLTSICPCLDTRLSRHGQ